MSQDVERFRKELAALGARITAKVGEFRTQGVMHGTARQEAAEFQIQHARVSREAEAQHITIAGAISNELVNDVEILKHTFDRWVAQIDKSSERGP
jgi:D-aminopeptidase